jgi:hypothetical protein
MKEDPWHTVSRRFGITRVVAAYSLREILARADVAAPGLLASQHITIKHCAPIEIQIGARGFEPPTSWSQTTRSTKLSYAPNMQRVVYHGFRPRASGERTRLACRDWWLANRFLVYSCSTRGPLRFATSRREQHAGRVRSPE